MKIKLLFWFFFKGLLAAIPLAFILPAVCYLKLEDGSVFSSLKIGSLGLAVFGIGATIIGIVSLIIQVQVLIQQSVRRNC
jgi:sodium-coupled neutral amino acid transporter 11